MAYASTYKASAAMDQLVDILTLQLKATMPTVVRSFDSSGNPCVVFSQDATPTADEKIAVLRIMPLSRPDAKDIFGNTANQYAGHVIQLSTEDINDVDSLTAVELLPILVECGRTGMVVEWYKETDGTAPTVARLVAGSPTLAATWRDLYWNVLKAS